MDYRPLSKYDENDSNLQLNSREEGNGEGRSQTKQIKAHDFLSTNNTNDNSKSELLTKTPEGNEVELTKMQLEKGNLLDDKEFVKSRSSLWQSVCNLVSDMEGTGLLGLPYVLLKGGWTALAALAIVPLIAFYTGKILVECLYEKDTNGCKVRVRSNYREMADASWPFYGGIIVVIVQVIELTFLASLYLVLSASLFHGMLPNIPINLRLWMLISAIVGLPTIFFRHLSQVAWISLLSVVALTIAVVIVVGYGFAQSPNWSLRGIPVWDTEGVPLALAIIIFSYICHPVLPGIEASMAKRSQFNIMLALSYGSVFLVKIVFAFSAFLSFYPNINEVITNSIPNGTIHVLVNSFLLVNVLFSYPFRVITIIQTLEDSVIPESFSSKFPPMLWFGCIRVFVNFFTLLPAISIPHFALFMAFIGSLTGSCVAFLFPCAFHLLLKSSEMSTCSKVLDVSIILFGIVAGILGIVATGRDLYIGG